MLTTSSEWGEMVTELTVPKEWKGLLCFASQLSICKYDWRIYLSLYLLSVGFCRVADICAVVLLVHGISGTCIRVLRELRFVLEVANGKRSKKTKDKSLWRFILYACRGS